MKNRTFALLLAALVMLLGAGATAWQKVRQEDGVQMQAQSAAVHSRENTEGEEFLIPVFGTTEQEYGAVYSEEYGQWTMCPHMTWTVEYGREVYAPLSGTVTKIEAGTEGGSCVHMDCGQAVLEIFPIYNVRVFSGSRVEQGEVLGEARECLRVRAYQNGLPIDPRRIGKTSSFDAAAGAEQGNVE